MKSVGPSVLALAFAAACGADSPPDASSVNGGHTDTTNVTQPARPSDPPETPQAVASLAGASADQLTIARFTGLPTIDVESESFASGEAIPLEFSAYGDNRSPQISWEAGPAGTESYTLIMEDPDLPGRPPFLHWVLGDIPEDVTRLEAAFATAPEGAFQTGVRENVYFGPRPSSGVHNYTFQLFALDQELGLVDGATRDEVEAAMQGHVLAAGALQATYTAPDQ